METDNPVEHHRGGATMPELRPQLLLLSLTVKFFCHGYEQKSLPPLIFGQLSDEKQVIKLMWPKASFAMILSTLFDLCHLPKRPLFWPRCVCFH